MKQKSTTGGIDEYIFAFPPHVQDMLQEIRTCISKAAPEADECINYGMPTYKLHGNLVHFAAFKKHIGFYPGPGGIDAYKEDLKMFESSKGTVQFPLEKPLPLEIIGKIVRFRVKENMESEMLKKSKRTCKKGHTYFKSSECPTCPICETEKKPKVGFFSALSAPARRALEAEGICSAIQLSERSQKSVMSLHGMGPASLPALKKALDEEGLNFKDS